MSESLSTYRAWLAGHIQSVLAQPALHVGSPAEMEITLLSLMEAWVAAWSLERGRSPEHDVARVTGLWRAACHRLRGPEQVHARLASGHAPAGFPPDELVRVQDGMRRVWDGVLGMCP